MRIGVSIETNRAHGRALIEGIGDWALSRGNWRLEMVDAVALEDAAALKRYDGLIVRVMDDKTEEALLKSGRPVVDIYGRKDSGAIPFMRLDDAAIARMAAESFMDHRYWRCGYCGMPGLRFSQARGAAFAEEVSRCGGKCTVYEAPGRVAEKTVGRERIGVPRDAADLKRWLRSLAKPVAVFCCSDLRAMHVLGACADSGIRVPTDVAVLGCDNDGVLCNFTNPPLSSIDTGASQLGVEAAKMLDALMDGNGTATGLQSGFLHKPLRVVERASTENYQVRTPWLSDALVHIRRHIAEGLNATELCRHIGLSHTTVGKAFHRELGTSVKREIARQRLQRACRMLCDTDWTAATVSAECGYPSPQYFSRVFFTSFGTTPEKWRRRRAEPDRRIGKRLKGL